MAFMVWCDLWQWTAQSPRLSALNSMARIWPTATSAETSNHWRSGGIQPPSVPVTLKSTPCTWIGWLVMVRLPKRIRTLSPWRATMGSMPGQTRLLKHHMFMSSIVLTLGT